MLYYYVHIQKRVILVSNYEYRVGQQDIGVISHDPVGGYPVILEVSIFIDISARRL